MSDRLQLQRFELKYFVSESVALGVRSFVSSHLRLDEHSTGQPNFSYPIHSLYLDSDELDLYQHTVNGNKNRYKLRLRYYNDDPNAPVFFEIKRRSDEAILKQRGAVHREAVDLILAGHLPEPKHLLKYNTKQASALQTFNRLMVEIAAKPKGHVAYLREAWESQHDNSVRVTIDRHVQFDPEFRIDLTTRLKNPVQTFERTIVELKFTGRFPEWFRELVRTFNLNQCSAAKYAAGVEKAMDRMKARYRPVEFSS